MTFTPTWIATWWPPTVANLNPRFPHTKLNFRPIADGDWLTGQEKRLTENPRPSALFNFLKPLALRSRTGWSLPTPTGLIWFVNLTNRLSRRSSLDDGAIMATCEEKAEFFCLIFISSENFVFFKLEMARSEIERNYTGKFKFQWDIKHSRQIFPTPLCIISHFQGVKKRFIKKS